MTSRLDAEQQALVASIQRPLRALAHEVAARFDSVDTDELAQVASAAACEVAGKHDPSKASFLTYAWTRAHGEMVDYASREERASEHQQALRRGFAKVTEIASELGDPLTESLASRKHRLDALQRAAVASATLAILSVREEDLPPDVRLERAEEQARIRALLTPALASLSPADRALVWGACVDDVSVADLARAVEEPYDRARYRFLRTLASLGESVEAAQRSRHSALATDDVDATHFR